MNKEAEYISIEKKVELEAELKHLNGPDRKAVLESLEFAKSLGDLSENAEYHQARDSQRKLEERIEQIEHVLKNAVIVKATHGGRITVGSTVVVQKVGSKETRKFSIVGSEEADMAKGKLSYKSPLGEALLNKGKGETVSFKSPAGIIQYKITDIE